MRPVTFDSAALLGGLFAAVVALSAMGCTEGSDNFEGCREFSDCAIGEICLQGYCVVPGAINQPTNVGGGSSGPGRPVGSSDAGLAPGDAGPGTVDAGGADAGATDAGSADSGGGADTLERTTTCGELRFSTEPVIVEFAPGSAIAQVQVSLNNLGPTSVLVRDVSVPITRGFRIQSPSSPNQTRFLSAGSRLNVVLIADPATAQATFLDIQTDVCLKSAQLLVESR